MDRIGQYGLPGGAQFYRQYIADGTVLRNFVQHEALTSEDLREASRSSGRTMMFRFKGLQNSTFHRMADALAAIYQIPDNRLGVALSALEQSYVLGTCAHDAYDVTKASPTESMRLPAARRLLAVSLATGSREEMAVATWMLAGTYITAWNIDEKAALQCAQSDRELVQEVMARLTPTPAIAGAPTSVGAETAPKSR